jgi:hypothetical protein
MTLHFTGFRLWALIWCVVTPIIAVIVPAHFDSMGWLWLLVPPTILLSLITAVCFAFIFTAPKFTSIALRVSRFSRITVVLLATGFGYLDDWFLGCAGEHGCNSRLAVLPGIVILASAWFMLYRFHHETSTAYQRLDPSAVDADSSAARSRSKIGVGSGRGR